MNENQRKNNSNVSHSNKQGESEGEEGLMVRLLMLSIEIDRKDNIIRELLDLASGE
jgi:hypothetical protein